ncbi:CCR4-Not complex component, Not1-domain-containing protein [Blakeslea trispora]|nr:CCR4-Not complex component, Not1-domain-containing protein [Blakeslea trispora]
MTVLAAKSCTNQSIVEQVQSLIALKANPEKLTNDQQFKQSVIEMYSNNPSSVTRILDLVKELNALPSILESLPVFLALDLACLANSQKQLHLESWLREQLSNQQQPQRDAYASQCLEFLNQKIFTELQRQTGPNDALSVPISPETMIILLKVLAENHLSPHFTNVIKEIHNRCLQTFPKIIDMKAQAMSATAGAEVSFKPEIEEEANMYYERIYSGEMSMDAMIELLKRLSASKDARDQDIYACMIHNLFDEYSFFPKYPEKELSITSKLFGLLIQHQIISYAPLGIALRYVLDALRNPVGSKMFNFGVQALEQFQSRLADWPQYCSHLLQIPHFVHSQPKLVALIQQILAGQQLNHNEDLTDQQGDSNGHTTNTNPPIPFTCVHVPSLKQTDEIAYSEPPSSVKDKVLFTVNNVALNNLETKVNDLKEALQPTSFKWFSNYLVVKRISSELNNHELYVLMLDLFDSKLLHLHVLNETFANILVLLNSDKAVANSSERALLKNLGSWLGRITLAKNKPILHKYIALKELLLEGYDTQRLIVTIPFVCKVLEQCAESKVFKPPNPWTLSILKLLVELYDHAELKLNLKFEIEVLCKGLSIELKSITPTNMLQSRQQPAVALQKNAFASQPNERSGETESSMEALPVPNLAPYLVFDPQIVLYTTQPGAKRLALQAFNESMREFIGPVVERAVAIAVVSTRNLVSKDFVTEMDENKMRKAAHLMVQNLAASLAMVTSKEPLRLSMVANLRAIFVAHGLNDSMAEQAIILTIADNLDTMCTLIEKAAMEKATAEIDEALTTSFVTRKKHREQRPNQPFIDIETYQFSRFPNSLPQPLRPKPSGLQPAQLSVYEDFARISRVAPNNTTVATQPTQPAIASINNAANASFPNGPLSVDRANARMDYPSYGSPAAAFESLPISVQPPLSNAHIIMEHFAQSIAELEKLISQTNINSITALPQQSEIRNLVRQISVLALSSYDKAEVARMFAQRVVQLLYRSERQLAIELYVALLEHLCEVSPNVGTLVTSWLNHADDERKYNVPVTVALIKAGLIHLPEQDRELSVLIDSGRISVIEFTVSLIRACLLSDYPLATRQEFVSSLQALNRLKTSYPSVASLFDDLTNIPISQQQLQRPPKDAVGNSKESNMRDQLQFYFAEWVHIHQHPATTEKTILAFATQLLQQSVFKSEDGSFLFFRVAIEVSIEHALKLKMLPAQSAPNVVYQPIDALSKLIVTLVQIEGQPTHLKRALSVTVLHIAQHHEMRGSLFDQRPFLRLLTSILNDLHLMEQQLQKQYISLLSCFSDTLYTLQPSYFPGFVFAWLQLVSHRFFMPQLLMAENQKEWAMFQRLVVCLFKFLSPYLSRTELRDTTHMLYRGALRMLLILLHDFPEFLCDYHYSFCDTIPATCIQMRNLVLSAFPRNMRLPDPFTPNLKVDLLPEIHQPPRILSNYSSKLEEAGLKHELDDCIEKSDARALKEILSQQVRKNSMNASVINAIVLHLGILTVAKGTPVHQGPAIDVYQHLLSELDSEGRYIFLSALANQLRYPNSHTHYFSCVLLYLFVQSKKETVKEQITRVLLERLIVNRPHPWGLLITFIELIKNPRYSFWSHSFTRCATDIERLFESVSR